MMRYRGLYMKHRRLICYAISFLLSLLFVAIAVLGTFRLSSLNSSAIRSVLLYSNYYNNLFQEIESDTKLYTIANGLPLKVLEGVFQLDEIQTQINNYIEETLHGRRHYTDSKKVKERLEQKIKDYLNEMNIRSDREVDQNIEAYIASVTEDYGKSLEVPILEDIVTINRDDRSLYYLITGVCVMVTLLILILYHKGKPWFYSTVLYIYTATFAAAIMLAVIPTIILSKELYNRLQIAPSSLYDLATAYIKINLKVLLSFSGIFCVISFLLLLFGSISRTNYAKCLKWLKKGSKLVVRK